jgi:DNA processing protein
VTIADEQLKYQIALTLLPGVGPVLAKNLVSYCGSVEEIFKKKKAQLEKIPGIGEDRAKAIVEVEKEIFERAEKEVAFIRKHKITPLFYTDENYPARLKNCDDAPPLLFFKGKCELNSSRMIAIVGTRNCTSYGKKITEQLVNDFAKYDVTVVSGLAYGIDIVAHKTAVKKNIPTIGVLAHGLNQLYPSEHKPTVENMVNNGGILTEFLSKSIFVPANFPSRNRIVAGMCDAVIVVESAIKGGALITADIANGYNRDVFAVPGRSGDKYSEGCNEFIRLNKAALLTSADQFAEMMLWEKESAEKKSEPKQLKIFHELKDEEKILVNLLQQKGKLDIDTISINANMPMSKVSSTLLNLEFAGVLKSLPGKMFELL